MACKNLKPTNSIAFFVKGLIFNIFFNTIFLMIFFIAIFSNFIDQDTIKYSLDEIVLNIALLLFGICSLIIIINSFITAKHFDKVWKKVLIEDSIFVDLSASAFMPKKYALYPRSARGILYAGNVVFKNKTKKNLISNLLFQGYDFRSNARLIDKIISFTIIYLLLGFLGLLILAFLIKLFIYFF